MPHPSFPAARTPPGLCKSAKSAPTISCPVHSARYLSTVERASEVSGRNDVPIREPSFPSHSLSILSWDRKQVRFSYISQMVTYVFREGQDNLLFLKPPRQMLPSESNNEASARALPCFASLDLRRMSLFTPPGNSFPNSTRLRQGRPDLTVPQTQ